MKKSPKQIILEVIEALPEDITYEEGLQAVLQKLEEMKNENSE